MSIKYVIGDATQPIGSGMKILTHICNDEGAWGAGFVLAISKLWKEPERMYRLRFHTMCLGDVQYVNVEPDLIVANMISQHSFGILKISPPPIRYEALKDCLKSVADKAASVKASVHMPRIGTGLAGGKWSVIEPIIEKNLNGISVTVYDFQ